MKKVAVSLYLYYTDLWLDFYELLSPIKEHIKLYLTLSYDRCSSFDHKYLDEFDHQLFYHNNYGADVAPFLNQLSSIAEPTFIKIHSKRACGALNAILTGGNYCYTICWVRLVFFMII